VADPKRRGDWQKFSSTPMRDVIWTGLASGDDRLVAIATKIEHSNPCGAIRCSPEAKHEFRGRGPRSVGKFLVYLPHSLTTMRTIASSVLINGRLILQAGSTAGMVGLRGEPWVVWPGQ
jgi:hypothetical protein